MSEADTIPRPAKQDMPGAGRGKAWLPAALAAHARAASVMTACLCLASLVAGPIGRSTSLAFLLAGIVLVGMPHGALDPLLAAPRLRTRLGTWWFAWFTLGYCGLAGLVMLGWALAPTATLIGFLALSIYHFGAGDIEDGLVPHGVPRPVALLTRGLLPILLPAVLWPQAICPVLSALAARPAAQLAPILASAVILIPPWLAGCCWLLIASLRGGRPARMQAAEISTLVAGFVLLPPLLSFAVYFCFCHAIRHLLRLGAWHAPENAGVAAAWAARVVVPFALLTAAGMLLLHRTAGGSILLTVPVFRLIAALTLPHLIVTSLMTPQNPYKTFADFFQKRRAFQDWFFLERKNQRNCALLKAGATKRKS